MNKIRYHTSRSFDARQWEVQLLSTPPWNTALVQWDYNIDPIDAGPDKTVQSRLSLEFIKLGHVLFCDSNPRQDATIVGTIRLSRYLGNTLKVILANKAEEVLDRVECSVFALKPYQFKSSIKP